MREVREAAARIARELLVNGSGETAERLVLIAKDGRDLGGWGETALRSRLEFHMVELTNSPAPDGALTLVDRPSQQEAPPHQLTESGREIIRELVEVFREQLTVLEDDFRGCGEAATDAQRDACNLLRSRIATLERVLGEVRPL